MKKKDIEYFKELLTNRLEELLSQAIEHGALGVLDKPVGIDELLKKLEGVKPEGMVLLAEDESRFRDWVEFNS